MIRRLFFKKSLQGVLSYRAKAILASTTPPSQDSDLDQIKNDLKSLREVVQQQLTSSPPNVPIGTILPYAGPIDALHQLPVNWMLCNGDELPQAGDYKPLFDKVGLAWGTPTVNTNFKLPDLRGIFLRGLNNNGGKDPENRQIGSIQPAATQMPKNPFVNNPVNDHQHVAPTNNGQGGNFEVPMEARGFDYVGGAPTSLAGGHNHTITGGDQETRPINAAVNWIIRVK